MDFPKFGEEVGLHRVSALLEGLSALHNDYHPVVIKVTGSNGKGSVCEWIGGLARQYGISCGLFTSPHWFQFNERIRVDGKPIPEADLQVAYDAVMELFARYQDQFPEESLKAFELFSLLAWHYFLQKRPRIVVLEVGIGGRYDPVRVFPGRLAVLTSIDLEHTKLLGGTEELIAYDKMDLCEKGDRLWVGRLDPSLRYRVEGYGRLKGLKMDFVEDFHRVEVAGAAFRSLGRVQQGNFSLALEAFEGALNQLGEPFPDPEMIQNTIKTFRMPGRCTKIKENPPTYIDPAHSPASVEAYLEFLRTLDDNLPVLLVTGVSHDKEVERMVEQFASHADAIICTRSYHKGAQVGADFCRCFGGTSGDSGYESANHRKCGEICPKDRHRTGNENRSGRWLVFERRILVYAGRPFSSGTPVFLDHFRHHEGAPPYPNEVFRMCIRYCGL